MGLGNICIGTSKHHYSGSITSLDLYLEMVGVKESQFRVASPYPLGGGRGITVRGIKA